MARGGFRRPGGVSGAPAGVRRLVAAEGQAEAGETREEAAVREVREETGHTCALGGLLGTVHYTAKGRAKEVTYWAARATGGVFVPNREVDAVAWLPRPRPRPG
ncbi:NUDIX domain-containing protein [Streptomyces sp. C8S0]|uniref:NUDIX domain-containing protein n=1 Tax=Streptomyces sp. C8S0 TaxID=2585716 RepID=UPI001D055554|nr:NUDIX domain-containing protein [Streptomyces sp. C8S0]